MVPEELQKVFESYDYEDFSFCVTKVDFSSEPLSIYLSMDVEGFIEEKSIQQKWLLQAVGLRKNRISSDYASNIIIKEDHPLLWEFTDSQCELYFNGQCTKPEGLFVELYKIYFELFRSAEPFKRCLNSNDPFQLIQENNGLLARGPKKLMTKYASCLTKYGLDYSIIGERPAKYWNGEIFNEERSDLKILFMNDTDTFIIAEDFVFNKTGSV
ncbi:MAG TPA: hypothetical protein VK563_18320 [Puia sp.]|nr:hypothetical protein [Puia sp.]